MEYAGERAEHLNLRGRRKTEIMTGIERKRKMSLLRVEHLRKEYGDVTPLRDVSFEVEEGEIISIIGPSGTGKSTLLRCINQLVEPTSGRVWFDGEEITDPACRISLVRQKMGMVFQQFNLFPDRTILENVIEAPIRLLKMPEEQAAKKGMELLSAVGLADKADRYPEELSGGQQQRAAIARAVIMEPRIMLFDEPTSALDPSTISEVQIVIRNLARRGMTMLIVTHELRFAREISTRVFYMDEGGICEDGTPEQIFEHPRMENTRRFIRGVRTLSLRIDAAESFDYPGAFSAMQKYGADNMFDRARISRMWSAFEEIVMLSLIPHLEQSGKGYPVTVDIQYAEADDELTVKICYGGDPYDPLNGGQSLAVGVIRAITSEIEYEFDDIEEMNILRIRL